MFSGGDGYIREVLRGDDGRAFWRAPVTLASGGRDGVDGLRWGALAVWGVCRPSVHTKRGVNKAGREESRLSWLSKERRTDSGPKGSR